MSQLERTDDGSFKVSAAVVVSVLMAVTIAVLGGGATLVWYIWDDRASEHETKNEAQDTAITDLLRGQKDILVRSQQTTEAYLNKAAAQEKAAKASAEVRPETLEKRAEVFDSQAETNRATARALDAIATRLEAIEGAPPSSTP